MFRVRTATMVATASLLCGLAASSGAVAASGEEPSGMDAWWYKGMGIAEAQQISTGDGVKIAVIDGPADPTVPELRGQAVTVKNLCGEAEQTGPIADHATAVAATLVGNGKGTQPGGVGVAGIAPDAEVFVYGIDIDAKPELQCRAMPAFQASGAAIDAAVADGAQIINLSVGAPGPTVAERAAVERALAAGVVIVAAAGNGPEDKAVNYPARYPGVVAVAAVDRNAIPWSNNVKGHREAFVISAPGVDIVAGGFDGQRWRTDGIRTGTSEAAPLVAGGLALVKAKYPSASGNQLIQHLIHNPGGTRTFGRDTDFGYGIMSVPKMLASDPAQWPDVNPLLPAAASAAPGGASQDGAISGEPVSATGADGGGGSSAGLVAGGLVALLVVAGAGFVLMRRRGQPGGGAASG